jgi:hypothetical protein
VGVGGEAKVEVKAEVEAGVAGVAGVAEVEGVAEAEVEVEVEVEVRVVNRQVSATSSRPWASACRLGRTRRQRARSTCHR